MGREKLKMKKAALAAAFDENEASRLSGSVVNRSLVRRRRHRDESHYKDRDSTFKKIFSRT